MLGTVKQVLGKPTAFFNKDFTDHSWACEMILPAVILEISAKATKSAKSSNGSFAVGALQLAP